MSSGERKNVFILILKIKNILKIYQNPKQILNCKNNIYIYIYISLEIKI